MLQIRYKRTRSVVSYLRTLGWLKVLAFLVATILLLIVVWRYSSDRARAVSTPVFHKRTVQIAAGWSHTMALMNDGSIYMWGSNDRGQLGDGTTTSRTSPTLLNTASTPMAGKKIIQVAAGDGVSYALDSAGLLYSWGRNTKGQLGIGTTSGPSICSSQSCAMVPQAVTPISGKTIKYVSVGRYHVLAVTNDGLVYGWGQNHLGRLGDGTETDRSVPVAVSASGTPMTGKQITQVSAADQHSLALASDGSIYSWGGNVDGKLGIGNNTGPQTCSDNVCSLTPVAVSLPGSRIAKSIATGLLNSSYTLATDGTVWGWGNNGNGRLGDGTTTSRYSPTQATGSLVGKNIVDLKPNVYHGLAVDDSGVAYSWGLNDKGQLGDGTTTENLTPKPVTVAGSSLAGKFVEHVATGERQSAVITSDGLVHMWGDGSRVGIGSSGNISYAALALETVQLSTPVQLYAVAGSGSLAVHWSVPVDSSAVVSSYSLQYKLVSSSSWTTVSGISDTSYAVTGLVNGSKYQVRVAAVSSFGVSAYTSSILSTPLGNPVVTSVVPSVGSVAGGQAVTISGENFILKDKDIIQVASGEDHTLALSSDGQVYAWGEGGDGQLGNGSTSNSSVPTKVVQSGVLAGKRITSMAIAGDYFSTVVASDGTVYSWGKNDSGQLGDGTNVSRSTPGAVSVAGTAMEGKQVVQVVGGDSHVVALASDGTVYAWGKNGSGQLGNGTTTNSTKPVAVVVAGTPLQGKKVVYVAAGDDHSIALTSDGLLYAWGKNENGQLGDATKVSKTKPSKVSIADTLGSKSIVHIAGGDVHSLAVDDIGGVYAWGSNGENQLGTGTEETDKPVAVATASTPMNGKVIVGVAAGYPYSAALSSEGVVYSWGNNSQGVLGNGSHTNSSSPVSAIATGTPISGKQIVGISAGRETTIVLSSDGNVYGWGQNRNGQLGNGESGNNYSLAIAASRAGSSALAPYVPGVTFGGNAATAVAIVNPTTITATTPAHARGLVDVSVDLGGSRTALGTSLYTYADVPGVPQGVVATPVDNGVSIAWNAPTDNGGSAITGYALQYKPSSSGSWTTVSGASSPYIASVPAGVMYDFRVATSNVVGTGAWSSTVSAERLMVSLSSSGATILVTPSTGDRMSSARDTVSVTTNGKSGYHLLLEAGSASRDLVHTSNSSWLISPSIGTQSTPLPLSGSSWGYRVDGVGGFGSGTVQESNVATSAYNWAGLPAQGSPQTIHTATSPATAETTSVWYGMSVSSVQPSGAYGKTVVYTAISN